MVTLRLHLFSVKIGNYYIIVYCYGCKVQDAEYTLHCTVLVLTLSGQAPRQHFLKEA